MPSLTERRRAYASDVLYATANEIGFDFLRDRLALSLDEQVQRPFEAAVVDEADSILIDEARIPLVITGGDADNNPEAFAAEQVVRLCANQCIAPLMRGDTTSPSPIQGSRP